MSDKRKLKMNADHLHNRAFERSAPVEQLENFNPEIWELKNVEVRTDTGKFVSTAWEVAFDEQTWWVVVGLHDTVKTVMRTRNKKGAGNIIVTFGCLYDKVQEVNDQLMEKENV
ncbi:MAG TPA: hypothetical protein VF610_12290 [Segetibacter sp.]